MYLLTGTGRTGSTYDDDFGAISVSPKQRHLERGKYSSYGVPFSTALHARRRREIWEFIYLVLSNPRFC